MKAALETLVLATHNAHKAREMRQILLERFPDLNILTLNDFPDALEPEETGTTMKENAFIKVLAGLETTRKACLADDGGLEVDALDGEPGVYSKRFGGESTPFSEKIKLLLEKLKEVPWEKRTARYRCVLGLAIPGHDVRFFDATCEGYIAFEPKGINGFGFDPIFWVKKRDCTMAELSAEEKNKISHRGKAIHLLFNFLKQNV